MVAGLNGGSGQFEFSLAAVGVGHRAMQHIPGSRRRSAAFLDHAMAPMSSWPAAIHGSTGLMRGDESRRNVPSSATRGEFKRALPRRAISGAPSSRSRQPGMLLAPVTSATLQPTDWQDALALLSQILPAVRY
jgi:hypothetical protein